MENGDADSTRAVARSGSPAEYASFGDYYASAAPHEVSPVGTAEGATAFSLFRVNDTVCAPDPATPDLTLQMFGRVELRVARCDFARGRFDMRGVPGVFSVSPAFTDCDYAGEGAFELLVLSMPQRTFASFVIEASDGTAPEPDVLHCARGRTPP